MLCHCIYSVLNVQSSQKQDDPLLLAYRCIICTLGWCDLSTSSFRISYFNTLVLLQILHLTLLSLFTADIFELSPRVHLSLILTRFGCWPRRRLPPHLLCICSTISTLGFFFCFSNITVCGLVFFHLNF